MGFTGFDMPAFSDNYSILVHYDAAYAWIRACPTLRKRRERYRSTDEISIAIQLQYIIFRLQPVKAAATSA